MGLEYRCILPKGHEGRHTGQLHLAPVKAGGRSGAAQALNAPSLDAFL
jgi:hypothetical protein